MRRRQARGLLLVADEDVTYLGRVVQRVVDPEHVTAGKAEHEADPLFTQRVDDEAPDGDGAPRAHGSGGAAAPGRRRLTAPPEARRPAPCRGAGRRSGAARDRPSAPAPCRGSGSGRPRARRRSSRAPSATCANCSIRRTPTPVAATASSTGARRLTTTGARPSESSSTRITFGLRDERLGEHDHLLLAAGEQAALGLPALLELGEELERLRDPAPRAWPGRARRSRRAGCPRR